MVKKQLRGLSLAVAFCAVVTTTSVQAASCWSDRAVSAAKVRDLETMLMVSALRCRLSGNDFLGDYNQFIRGSRPALIHVNETLRSHFSASVGKAGALNAYDSYDSYVTSIANSYGGGVAGLDCTDMRSILGAAAAAGHSLASLENLAERAKANPSLPGGRCGLTIAGTQEPRSAESLKMAAR